MKFVQLEEGSVATPFEQRPIGLEESLCKRYYRTLFIGTYRNIGTARGTGTTGYYQSHTQYLDIPMRTTPSSDGAKSCSVSILTANTISNTDQTTTISAVGINSSCFRVDLSGGTVNANGKLFLITTTADTTTVGLDAEL